MKRGDDCEIDTCRGWERAVYLGFSSERAYHSAAIQRGEEWEVFNRIDGYRLRDIPRVSVGDGLVDMIVLAKQTCCRPVTDEERDVQTALDGDGDVSTRAA